MDSPNYYAVIPANIRYDENLTPNAKLLYGEITALCNKDGTCWASNDYFSDKFKTTKKSIGRWLKELVDGEHIYCSPDVLVVNNLMSKNMGGMGYGSAVCEWCKVRTSVLHAHHYPILKSNGGTETVNICPNCHHEFHNTPNVIKIRVTDEELDEILKFRVI